MLQLAEQVDELLYTPRRNSQAQPGRDRRFTQIRNLDAVGCSRGSSELLSAGRVGACFSRQSSCHSVSVQSKRHGAPSTISQKQTM
jgi:hypothetical protein